MKVVQTEEVVPARTVTHTKYVAEDGREFAWRQDCERYEERLHIESHPVMKSRINGEGVETFIEGIGACLYYLRDEEDAEFLADALHKYSRFVMDEYQGPGWYMYWYEDGGDYPGDDYFMKFTKYVDKISDQMHNWLSHLDSLMHQKWSEVYGSTT